MLVQDLMSQPVVICQVGDKLNQAAQLMWEKDCGVIPVLDGNGCVIAMLTDRDICMAAYTQGRALSEISVATAMSKGLCACGPEDTVEQVERLMREHQLRRLPVLNPEGQPVGIISLNDVARAAIKKHPAGQDGKNGVSLGSTARTLAALCVPALAAAGPKLL